MVTSWYDTQQCKSGLHKSDPKARQGSCGIIWTAAKPPDREAEGPKWTAAATRPAVVVQRKPPVPRARTVRTEPAARPAVVVRRKPPVPKRPRPAPRRAPTIDEVPVPKTPPLDERALKQQFDGIFSGEPPAPPTPQPVSARAAQTTDRLHRDAASRRAALDARRKRAATHDDAGAPLFTPRLTARWRPTTPKEPALTPRLDPSPTSVSTPTLEASATRLSPAKTTPRRPAPVKMPPTPPPKQPSPRQKVARARRAADAASLERALVAACRARDDGDAGEAAAVAGVVAQSDVAFLCLAYRRWGAVGPDLGGGSCDDEGAWGERAAWAVWAAAELDAAKDTVAAAALARRLVAQRTGPAAAFTVAAVRHGSALAKARAEARRQEKLAETVLPFAPSFATPKAQREALAARANARAGADGLSFTDAARVKAARAEAVVAEKRVERDRREADECTFTPNAKRRESITPVARAKPPQSERPPPPPPPPPPPKRDEVVLSERPPPPKRDVDVDLGFVRVRLAASDGDDLPALVDAAAAAHGLDGAQQDRLLVALAAAVLG